MLIRYWASGHGSSVHSQIQNGFPKSSRAFLYGDPMAEKLQNRTVSNASPMGKSKNFFVLTNLLRFVLIEQARSSACFWISSSGQKHGLLWWARKASYAPHLRQRFSSRPQGLRKQTIYFPSKYWEMENSFLKASKPKSSYLVSFIKGGAFCTNPVTLLYIFVYFVYLHQYKVMGSYLVQ